jgi:hypothetical protein
MQLKVDSMTETEVNIGQLQKNIAHLAGISEEGWILQWGNSPQTEFKVVCRKANALQIEKLEAILSDGHRKALSVFQ